MAFVGAAGTAAAIGLGVSALGSGVKLLESGRQRRAARRIREENQDPGIQPNQELRRVNNMLYDRYTNYNLPGYTRYAEQIRGTGANSLAGAIQGATSSADVLAAVSQNQSIQNNALNNLNQQQVSGEEQALMAYLNSLNAVGEDNVRINMLENQRYDQAINEAAQLEGAATQNTSNAINELSTTATAMALNYTGRKTDDDKPKVNVPYASWF